MFVLNQVEYLNILRPLNVLDNNEIHISYFFLTGSYLTPVEKNTLKELSINGRIFVFDQSNDFFNFSRKVNLNESKLSITDLSSVFYALNNNYPIITDCNHLAKFSRKLDIKIVEIDQALEELKISREKIEYFKSIRKII